MAFPVSRQDARVILHLQNTTQQRMNSTEARENRENILKKMKKS